MPLEKNQQTALKKELKVWERSFIDAHGRKPLKCDIDKCPAIASKYKLYSQLSKSSSTTSKAKKKEVEEVIAGTPQGSKKRKVLSLFDQPAPQSPSPSTRRQEGRNRPATLHLDTQSPSRILRELERDNKGPSIRGAPTVETTTNAGTPLRKRAIFDDVMFISPRYRPGQCLGLDDTPSGACLAALTPRRENLLMMSSPVPMRRVSNTIDGDGGDGDEQSHPMLFGSAVVDERHVKLDKKPLLGKRQTSKRRLAPVSTAQELEQYADSKPAKSKSRDTGGVRLKLNKRGKSRKFINHAVVDRQRPMTTSYSMPKECSVKEAAADDEVIDDFA